jgi:hypothetical protein
MNIAKEIAIRHFGKKVVHALAREGVEFIGTCVIPGEGPLPMANGSTGYQVSDKGTGKVWSYSEVLAAHKKGGV